MLRFDGVICDRLEHCQNISLPFDGWIIMEIGREFLGRRLQRAQLARFSGARSRSGRDRVYSSIGLVQPSSKDRRRPKERRFAAGKAEERPRNHRRREAGAWRRNADHLDHQGRSPRRVPVRPWTAMAIPG